MLIDVSNNRNSPWCQVIEHEDENVSKLGLPFIQYYTQADHKHAVEWLYPGGHLDSSATILCSTNESVDMWNAIAQGMNTSEEQKDSFSKVDDINGHLKKMLSDTLLNGLFQVSAKSKHEFLLE